MQRQWDGGVRTFALEDAEGKLGAGDRSCFQEPSPRIENLLFGAPLNLDGDQMGEGGS